MVFQGASVAFDLSMEEIWVPYLVGATLFVASPSMMGDVEALPGIIAANGITVLDTVPTLLAMITGDLPKVRLVLLGGEALPEPLIAKWATATRQLFNTYGTDRGDGGGDRRRDAPRRNGDDRRADPELFGLCGERGASPARAREQGEFLLIGGLASRRAICSGRN